VVTRRNKVNQRSHLRLEQQSKLDNVEIQ